MNHGYNDIISIKNLCDAWREFLRGKKVKLDVVAFSLNLSQNIFRLHEELRTKTYQHGAYEAFSISDPKPRNIHKATVRDRLLHHAVYRILYPYFDKRFIYDSYSCRHFKGTHRALNHFREFARRVSHNHSRTCWALKCDVRKFFASIDQAKLMNIFTRHIVDADTVWLIGKIVGSFESTGSGKGLPLGNLTSQLLVNVYMNEFDQFIKHKMKIKYYLRYADDFVILDCNKDRLLETVPKIVDFLDEKLKLELHPSKIFLKTVVSGVDFLGWINFSHHRVLRTATKRRMLKRIKQNEGRPEVWQSYLGMLSHGNGWKLKKRIETTQIGLKI